MTATTALLEPSFADLIAAIEQAAELSQQTRRHWVCSARQIARWLDRPAAVIPARWISVQISVAPTASRSGRRHREDPGESQIQCPGGAALVRQGARRAAARNAALPASWATFRDRIDKRLRRPALQPHTLLLGPPASSRRRSTTGSLMSIGATAPRRPHWHRTIPRRRFMARTLECLCRCNRWLAAAAAHRAAHQSQGRARLGRLPRGPAPGSSTTISDRLTKPRRGLKRPAHSAMPARHDPDPPGRTRRDGAHGGSARRADREPDLACARCSTPMWSNGSSTPIGRRMAMSRKSGTIDLGWKAAANGPRDGLPGPSRT